ncbi:MAG: hypothetical protein Q8R76_12860 [Candidatus Omnitrophota bacterium]|nr:hypothetical protein [Candidatus Omnitrophota bacterium]
MDYSKRIGRKASERGFLLFTTYMLISVLSIFSLAFLARGTQFLQATERNQNRVVAFNMAEAAVDLAIAELTADDTYAGIDGFTDLSTDQIQGGYTLTVTTPEGNEAVRLIQATGFAPNNENTSRAFETRSVITYVVIGEVGFFDFAIFAEESIDLNGTSLIDSYNSSEGEGEYDAEDANSNGDLGTDSGEGDAVDIGGNSSVQGNAVVGPDGNPNLEEENSVVDLGPNASISGTISAAPEERDYDVQTTGLVSEGQLKLSGSTVQELPAGTYHYDSISISGNAQLQALGPVEIFVSGTVSIGGNGVSTSSNLPPNFIIYVTTDATVSVGGNGNFYGAIYAPDSSVNLNGGGNPNDTTDFHGAIVANQLNQNGHMNIHYDEALEDVGSTGSGDIQILSWQEANTFLGNSAVS